MSDDDFWGPTPLEYETPPLDFGPAEAGEVASRALLVGIVAWFVLAMVVCGSGSVQIIYGPYTVPPSRWQWAWPLAAMAALAAVATLVYVNNRRDPRRSRREFVLALLLGVGAAVLIHGACFAFNVTQ